MQYVFRSGGTSTALRNAVLVTGFIYVIVLFPCPVQYVIMTIFCPQRSAPPVVPSVYRENWFVIEESKNYAKKEKLFTIPFF